MKGEDSLLLVLNCLLLSLEALEKPKGGRLNLLQGDRPHLLQLAENFLVFFLVLKDPFSSHELNTNDSIGYSFSMKNFDPSNLRGLVAVCSATGLDIDPLYIDYSESVPRDHSPLVEFHAKLRLSNLLLLKSLIDMIGANNSSIGCLLNEKFLLFAQPLEVANINMSVFNGLLGSLLPDVLSQHGPGRGEDYMGCCVVSLKDLSSLLINESLDCFAKKFIREILVQKVEDAFSYFLHIDYIIADLFNDDSSEIVLLSTRGWVETGPVQYQDVPHVLALGVGQNTNDFSPKMKVAFELVLGFKMIEVHADSL